MTSAGTDARLLRERSSTRKASTSICFVELYCSAAEPLPETPAAADGDKGDADISHKLGPWDVLADIELHDDDWNPDFPSVDLFTRLTTASQSRVVGLPARYLPHGRLHDLYWMFLSAWDFLASAERSDVTTSGKPPSFVTFWRQWQVWKTHLKFRKSSQHAQCQTCWELQQQMHTLTVRHGQTGCRQPAFYAHRIDNNTKTGASIGPCDTPLSKDKTCSASS